MREGQIVQGQIKQILKTHFIVEIKGGWTGLVHVSKISDYFVTNIGSMFHVGDKHYFQVIEVEEEERRVKLCWKTIMPRFQKDPFEFEIQETEKGFDNLRDFVQEKVDEVKDD